MTKNFSVHTTQDLISTSTRVQHHIHKSSSRHIHDIYNMYDQHVHISLRGSPYPHMHTIDTHNSVARRCFCVCYNCIRWWLQHPWGWLRASHVSNYTGSNISPRTYTNRKRSVVCSAVCRPTGCLIVVSVVTFTGQEKQTKQSHDLTHTIIIFVYAYTVCLCTHSARNNMELHYLPLNHIICLNSKGRVCSVFVASTGSGTQTCKEEGGNIVLVYSSTIMIVTSCVWTVISICVFSYTHVEHWLMLIEEYTYSFDCRTPLKNILKIIIFLWLTLYVIKNYCSWSLWNCGLVLFVIIRHLTWY